MVNKRQAMTKARVLGVRARGKGRWLQSGDEDGLDWTGGMAVELVPTTMVMRPMAAEQRGAAGGGCDHDGRIATI